MKTGLFVLSIVVIMVMVAGCGGQSDTAEFKDGTYTGIAQGYGGEIEVQVTVQGGRIETIEILRDEDTPGISDNAKEQTKARIIENQSTDIELVTGATATSRGVRDATQEALEGARNN